MPYDHKRSELFIIFGLGVLAVGYAAILVALGWLFTVTLYMVCHASGAWPCS